MIFSQPKIIIDHENIFNFIATNIYKHIKAQSVKFDQYNCTKSHITHESIQLPVQGCQLNQIVWQTQSIGTVYHRTVHHHLFCRTGHIGKQKITQHRGRGKPHPAVKHSAKQYLTEERAVRSWKGLAKCTNHIKNL